MHAAFEFETDLAGVPAEVRPALAADYARGRKSAWWAYVWWGVAGAHYAYLGKRREQGVFALTLGGLGIWWAVDAVRIPRLVAAANADLQAQLLARYTTFAPRLGMRPAGTVRGSATAPVLATPARTPRPAVQRVRSS